MENQQKIHRKSTENPQKIHRKSTENPQRINRKSTENPQKIHRESTENQQKIHRESTENPQKIHRESTENPQKIHRESTENPQRIHRKSTENPQKIHRKSTENPQKIHRNRTATVVVHPPPDRPSITTCLYPSFFAFRNPRFSTQKLEQFYNKIHHIQDFQHKNSNNFTTKFIISKIVNTKTRTILQQNSSYPRFSTQKLEQFYNKILHISP